MKHINRLLLSAAITALLTACGGSNSNPPTPVPVNPPPVDGGTGTPQTGDAQFAEVRNTAQRDLQRNIHSPAVSVAILQDGEVVFAEAFGTKSFGGSEAVGKDTLFQLGSVTKMFTALGTLKLADQGRVDLDAPLVQTLMPMDYADWQAQSWEAITLKHLLTHQSGLVDDYDIETINQPLLTGLRDTHTQNTRLMNPPGKFYNYSNPNYSYLGAIIENEVALDYRSWMKAEIFGPLGMPNTTMFQNDVADYGDYALGSHVSDGRTIAMQRLEDIATYTAGVPSGAYTWSTATELLNMATFLFDGDEDILTDSLREQMVHKQVQVDATDHYGYGIGLTDHMILDNQWYEQAYWYHSGATENYRALLIMVPDQNIAVAVLNSGPGDFGATLVSALRAVLQLPNPQPVPTSTVNSDNYPNHVGTYIDYANELTFIVETSGNTLTLTIPEFDEAGQNYSRVLTPIGNELFSASTDDRDFYFSFIPEEESGESVYLRSREAVGIKVGYEPWSGIPE